MTVAILGIRHHGPGSARAVTAALAELQPDCVLVEGPPEADAVLPLVADPDMEPPVALLGYALEMPERAVFYPFASFSPEWQAFRHAAAHGVPVHGCDLALAHQLAPAPREPTLGGRRPADPLGVLAHAAGYDDAERWWEDVVEHRADGPFAAIEEAMAAVRADALYDDEREAQREAAMRQSIRAALARGHERVAVVCGAWHAPALAEPLPPASADTRLLRGLPKVKVAVTWVPWTHRRLASASGYGAGVTAPGWYHHLFTHPGPHVLHHWFAQAAQLLREADRAVAPGHVIEAVRLAEALAAVRSRPLAGLDEVTDAGRAVLGDGGDAPMVLLHERLVVGQRLGSVPDRTPMVPLARDVAAAQKRLRLKPEAHERHLELDVRRARDRARSHLLHRLSIIGVRWGIPIAGRGSSGTFRETWVLQWEPELSVALIDASARGTTVLAAAAATVREQAAAPGATLADLTGLVEACLLADLRAPLTDVLDRVAGQAAVDTDVSHLLDGLGPLARASRYGDVRATDAGALAEVAVGMLVRACAALPLAVSALDDAAASALAARLTAANAAVALLDDASPDGGTPDEHARARAHWVAALDTVVGRAATHPTIRGRAVRLLLDAGRLPAGAARRFLSQALSYGTPPARGAAFVEGLLAGSGTVLLHDDDLLGIVDDWVASIPADGFLVVVPLLRRTFASFDAGERRALGERLNRGAGHGALPADDRLDAARVDAALAALAELMGVGR